MMYFDLFYYHKVLLYTWKQKQWPKRNKMLVKLLLIVPLLSFINSIFFLLDYIFFPALWQQKVEKPVFIIGHARSGTTLMHRLMAADGDRFSYYFYWQMFLPSLLQRKIVSAIGWLDQKFLNQVIKHKLEDWDEKTFGPYRHIHKMGLWIAEEDQFVMNAAFVTQQWALDLPLMNEVDIFHIDNLSSIRRKRWMNFYKECVKRQLLQNGGNKFHLSKNPIMSGWVNAILETFPDARIVVMIRDPIQCIPSTLKLVESTWQRNAWTAQQYADSLQTLCDISFASFHLPKAALTNHPNTPHYFVDYRDLTSEPVKTVTRIYKALDMQISDQYRDYLIAQEEKEKSHISQFEYNIDEYEITPERIEEELSDFYEQYGWPRLSKKDIHNNEELNNV